MDRKIVLLIILIGYTLSGKAYPYQIQIDPMRDSIVAESKGVYNFRGEPASCVDNLETLFNSWPIEGITNAKDIDLISYTSYGAIKDTAEISYYAVVMSQWNTPRRFSVEGSQGRKAGKYYSYQFIEISTYGELLEKVDNKDREVARREYEADLSEDRKFITDVVQVGDWFFSIKFRYRGEEMESYIVCDHESHKVIVDFIFLNLNVGMYDKNGNRVL